MMLTPPYRAALVAWLAFVVGCAVEYTVPLETDGEGSAETSTDDDEDDEDGTCAPPLLACSDDQCIDPETDPANCGDCGNDCDPGGTCVEAECIDSCSNSCDVITEVCVSGTCECRPGFDRCGGTCVDLDIDAAHCGDCGRQCVENDDGELELNLCRARDCVDDDVGCGPELSLCGQSCVDLETHPLHCNACNRSCNGDEVCIEGECLEA